MNKYKVEKFDVTKEYIHPVGYLYTKEFLEKDKPAVLKNPEDWFVVTDPTGRLAWYIESIFGARDQLKIDLSISNEDALKIIEEARNKEPEPVEYVPTLEEKTQALEEFKALKDYEYGTYTIAKDNFIKGLWSIVQLNLALEQKVITQEQLNEIVIAKTT